MRASGENVKNSTGSDFREGQSWTRALHLLLTPPRHELDPFGHDLVLIPFLAALPVPTAPLQTPLDERGAAFPEILVRDLVFATVPLSWPTPPGHADDDSVRFPLQGSPRAWPREPVGQVGSERLWVGRSPHVRKARPFAGSRGRPWNIGH